MLNLYFILEVSTSQPHRNFRPGPQIVLFGLARSGINILQNLYNSLTIFCGEGVQKLMKILLSMGIISDLISVQLQTCEILKTKYYF